MNERPRRIEPIKNRPVREQATIHLVSQLRRAFQRYVDAFDEAERQQALADFNRASVNLEIIGIPLDDSDTAAGPDR